MLLTTVLSTRVYWLHSSGVLHCFIQTHILIMTSDFKDSVDCSYIEIHTSKCWPLSSGLACVTDNIRLSVVVCFFFTLFAPGGEIPPEWDKSCFSLFFVSVDLIGLLPFMRSRHGLQTAVPQLTWDGYKCTSLVKMLTPKSITAKWSTRHFFHMTE